MQQPVYIVPLLVEQPTWGGKYIAGFKNISDLEVASKNIGQSFELTSYSYVTSDLSDPGCFAFATPSSIKEPQFFNRPSDIRSLQEVIDQDPEGILGKKSLTQYGPSMQVLIKFTQAQNNSYQAHVKPGQEFGKWQAKPESWYYFEQGKATLGLRAGGSVEEYKQRCIEIDKKAQELSAKVLGQDMNVAEARTQLKQFIDQDHPSRFVNTVTVDAQAVIDLSSGGIHHSWEMGREAPQGNIVYEVQKDVLDEFCTLRSFDQGNIKDDGKVRPLTIEDYFKALDIDPERNKPETAMQKPASKADGSALVTQLFDSPFYKTTLIEFSGEYSGAETETAQSFHHLFTQEGSAEVVVDGKAWKLPKGTSLFIPANTGKYILKSAQSCKVLKTFI
jgi:mannose-6-phosphate isomerase class I